MTEHMAVLVEDELDQAEFTEGILRQEGYEVISFNTLSSALKFLDESNDLVDLFVLDRRLPMRIGDDPTNELGDTLFERVRADYSDSRIIIFTGFADLPLIQGAMESGGQFPIRVNDPINLVSVLTKDQSLEFRRHVKSFRSLLQELDDIEIRDSASPSQLSELDRRCLRRVAYEFDAVCLIATKLAGGLTGAKVWKCEIRQAQGHAADVVVKQVKKPAALGGLQDLLPLHNSASSRGSVSGLAGGNILSIQRLAGNDVQSLSAIILSDPKKACSCIDQFANALKMVEEQSSSITLATLGDSLISWDEMIPLMDKFGVSIPSPTMKVTVRMGLRHGDLHASNVMVDGCTPVLIDFDSNCFSSSLLDPVTLLISTLVHPDSPIRGDRWPTTEEIKTQFGANTFGMSSAANLWFERTWQWIESCQSSPREFWGLVLAYAVRQLQYGDVVEDESVLSRMVEIARRAAVEVQSS